MHGKASRVCLGVGPSYPWIRVQMHGKAWETKRHWNSSRCRQRTLVASTLIGVFWCVLWVPHSGLQYGTGLIGSRETWIIQYMVEWNVAVPSSVSSLNSLMRNSFPWFFIYKGIGLYMDSMASVFMVFFLLCCWLWACILTVTMYGSPHVSICKWINNVSMT